jgi:hypothetical protein
VLFDLGFQVIVAVEKHHDRYGRQGNRTREFIHRYPTQPQRGQRNRSASPASRNALTARADECSHVKIGPITALPLVLEKASPRRMSQGPVGIREGHGANAG